MHGARVEVYQPADVDAYVDPMGRDDVLLWAPKDLGLTFDLDPFLADKLTLVSGNVSAAGDAAGGSLSLAAPTSGQRPALDSVNTINGRPCLVTSNAANTALRTTTGGISGNADHHVVAVVRYTATTSDPYGLGSIAGFGQNSGSIGTPINSIVGSASSVTAGWGGGPTYGNPYGGSLDTTSVHIISTSLESGVKTLRVDGKLAASASGQTYNLSSGLGLFGWYSNTGMSSARVYRAVWLARGLEASITDRRKLERYLGVTYSLTNNDRPQIQCVGDSLTVGYASSDPATKSYPARLAAYIANAASTDIVNWGVSGRFVETMYQQAGAQEDKRTTGVRPFDNIVLWGGSNNVANGDTAAYIWTQLKTYLTGRRATGARVIVCTILQRTDIVTNGRESIRLALNTLIRAEWSQYADALADLAADSRLSTSTVLTYFNADGIHLTDAGYDVVAQIVAQQVQT